MRVALANAVFSIVVSVGLVAELCRSTTFILQLSNVFVLIVWMPFGT